MPERLHASSCLKVHIIISCASRSRLEYVGLYRLLIYLHEESDIHTLRGPHETFS